MELRSLLYPFITLVLSYNSVSAQTQLFSTVSYDIEQEVRTQYLDSFRNLSVFENQPLKLQQWNASIGKTYDDITREFKISVPLPTGEHISFNITNSQTLGTPFRHSFPTVYNFKGHSADGRYGIRLTSSSDVVYAKIKDHVTHREWVMHPEQIGSNIYILFDKSDDLRTVNYNCLVDDVVNESIDEIDENEMRTMTEAGVGATRTYKIMVSLTGGFTTMLNGVPNSVAALASTIDRVSEIYERDLNVRLNLVTNDTIIFTSSNPGIFAGVTRHTPALIDSNLNLFRSINPTTYDLGHVFSNISGGVAYSPSLCNDFQKAGASTGTPNFPSEHFIYTVAHEIAHQFNARHTHSANTGSCGSTNFSGTDSWEIGGGSGIMSYAGSCAPLAYTNSTYNFFNAGTILKMHARMAYRYCTRTGVISNSPTNLHSPIITNAIANYTIPINTPFKLQLEASDQDGDVLTYAFDQNDASPLGMNVYPTGSEGVGPLFKHIVPTLSNERRFPSLVNLANRNMYSYEVLPQVARTLNFIGFVRDNHLETGRSAYHNFVLTVDAGCDSFAFTNLLVSDTFYANGTNTVVLNWSTASCVYNGNVNIRFSTDGGLTYPYMLDSNTLNDGTTSVVVPKLPTNNGRFMIEAVDHILFNVNKSAVVIRDLLLCSAEGALLNNDTTITKNVGDPSLNLSLQPIYGTAVTNFISDYSTHSSASNLAFWNPLTRTCSGPNNINVSKVVFEGYVDQSDSFTFSFSSTGGPQVLNVYRASFDNNNICQQLLMSSGQLENNVVTLYDHATVYLEKSVKYYVVMQTFNSNVPNTAAFNVSYSSPTSGMLYQNGTPDPGANYNYGYVIVNNVNNTIKEIKATPDLSDPSDYQTGTFSIYGISSMESVSNLHSNYENVAYTTLYQDVLVQNNNLCAELSLNMKIANIIQPLNIDLIAFDAELREANNGFVYWKAIESNDLIAYDLEKSDNAIDFYTLGTFDKLSTNDEKEEQRYSYIDNHLTGDAYYRLRIKYQEGKQAYSKVIKLVPGFTKTNTVLFPNPVKNNTVLNIQTTATANDVLTVVLLNVLGKTVATHQVVVGKANEMIKFPVQNLTSGFYQVGIIRDNTTSYHKLTVIE